MARYTDADLKDKFGKIRKLCDQIWEAKGADIPEFTLEAMRKHASAAPFYEPCTVWVHSKNGEAHVGDMALMAGLVSSLRRHGIKLVCMTNPSFAPLLADMRDVFEVVPYSLPKNEILERLSEVTHHSNWSNLMRRMQNVFPESSIEKTPYLKVDDAVAATMQERYRPEGDKPLIGIVWRTSLIGRNPMRDSTLKDWRSVVRKVPAHFVSLQYGSLPEIEKDISEAKGAGWFDLHHDEQVDSIGDLPAYAAQIKACDFVVTIDCSTVFLAGGLGKKTLTLIPHDNPSFRWNGLTNACPFFAGNRLFRQGESGGWAPVLETVSDYLLQSAKEWMPQRPETKPHTSQGVALAA